MRLIQIVAVGLAFGLAVGCSDTSPQLVGPDGAAFGNGNNKGGGGGGGGGDGSAAPIIELNFADVTTGGVAVLLGHDGSPSYVDGVCGVSAVLSTYKKNMQDMIADVDGGDASQCGSARSLVIDFGDGTTWTFGAKFIVRNLHELTTVGASHEQWMGFGHTDLSNCPRIVFDSQFALEGSEDAVVTLLSDVPGARQWRVESQAPHKGVCVETNNRGDFVRTSVDPYTLPFSFTITERQP